MTLITIQGNYGYISELPAHEELDEALLKETSYRPVGYQYTTLFQQGRSDGRIKLMRRGRFPVGLQTRVVRALRAHGVDFDLHVEESELVKPEMAIELWGVQAREYQARAVEAAAVSARGVIQVPVGGGKTAIGTMIVAARGQRALVVVPTIDLLYQYKSFVRAHSDADVGQLGDGVVDPRPFTVATVRTAANALGVAYETYEYGEYDDRDDTDVSPGKLREFFDQVGTLIVDEVQIVGSQTAYDICMKVPAEGKYGTSASPWRDDGADLKIEAAIGPRIYTITPHELVRDKWLVPPIIRVYDTKGWWQPRSWGQVCTRCGKQRGKTSGGRWAKKCGCGSERWRSEYTQAYKHEIVDNPIRNSRIADIVNKLDGPTLVLVKQIKHGRALQRMIHGSVFLSGKDKSDDRTAALEAVRQGDTRVLIATVLADMGLDLPMLRNLVLAGGGKSSVRHLQRIGRVVRSHPGKTMATVIRFDDSHCHTWFANHVKAQTKIEKDQWGADAIWI